MYKVGICDDNPQMLQTIESTVHEAAARENLPLQTKTYSTGELLLWDVQEGLQDFDILLLDIEMPGVTGMDLSTKLQGLLPEARILLVTDHMRYVLDAFELSVFRYVPKSELSSRLPRALADAVRSLDAEPRSELIIRSAGRVQHISFGALLFVDRCGKNARLHMRQGSVSVRWSLGRVMEELDPDQFVYLDRGIIVNLAHIDAIHGHDAVLSTGGKLPISRKRLSAVRHQFTHYWSRRL